MTNAEKFTEVFGFKPNRNLCYMPDEVECPNTDCDKCKYDKWLKEEWTGKAEQRTGYWIMHFDEISPTDSTMECSECGEELTVMYVKGDYCPNCGSKNKVKHGDKKK